MSPMAATAIPAHQSKRRPRRKGGAFKMAFGGETKNQRPSTKSASPRNQPSLSVYSGRDLVGFIKGGVALDVAGREIGAFRNRAQAMLAVLNAAANKGAVR